MIISTYCCGFKLKCLNDITKGEYIQLCDLLTTRLGIQISPEQITEGGMRFNGIEGYKCLRHQFCGPSRYWQNIIEWPHINENVHDEWKDSSDILLPKNTRSHTCLKAFDGAPAWTLGELRIFKECFEQFHLKCTKMPLKRDLCR